MRRKLFFESSYLFNNILFPYSREFDLQIEVMKILLSKIIFNSFHSSSIPHVINQLSQNLRQLGEDTSMVFY